MKIFIAFLLLFVKVSACFTNILKEKKTLSVKAAFLADDYFISFLPWGCVGQNFMGWSEGKSFSTGYKWVQNKKKGDQEKIDDHLKINTWPPFR